jgi:hypothetical protein
MDSGRKEKNKNSRANDFIPSCSTSSWKELVVEILFLGGGEEVVGRSRFLKFPNFVL